MYHLQMAPALCQFETRRDGHGWEDVVIFLSQSFHVHALFVYVFAWFLHVSVTNSMVLVPLAWCYWLMITHGMWNSGLRLGGQSTQGPPSIDSRRYRMANAVRGTMRILGVVW